MRRTLAGIFAMAVMCGCQISFSTVGTWTRESPPPAPITSNNVVALSDGRVAVFGGILPNGVQSNQTTLYNPSTRSWGKGAPMPGPSDPDVVVRLPDGSVLLEGGTDPKGNVSGATWLYDATGDAWSRAGNMIEPRSAPSHALLTDGRLLIVAGGISLNEQTAVVEPGFKPIASAEIYDPTVGTWSQAGHLATARFGISLAALEGGGALAVGGCQGVAGFSPPVTTAELFDPGADAWSVTSSLPTGICAADAVGLRDGRALVLDQHEFFGGPTAFYPSSDNAYAYDPKTRSWSLSGGLAGGGTAALTLTDGRVLVPELRDGAQKGRVFTEMVGGQVFDPESDQWTYASTTALPLPVSFMFSNGAEIAVPLPDGDALLILKNVTLAFHPRVAPAASQVLDSAGLTVELVVALAVIAVLLLLAYRRAGRIELRKLQ